MEKEQIMKHTQNLLNEAVEALKKVDDPEVLEIAESIETCGADIRHKIDEIGNFEGYVLIDLSD